jgi:ubiquinone/menaquinone biosynthesis C-methylase UbiE
MPSDTGSAFDSLASTYDAWYETPVGRLVDRLEKEAVFELVSAKPGDLSLDLSCGTGNYALALAERGARVVGVDLSEPMLRRAAAKARLAGAAIALVRADAGALPFRARTFDLVTDILGLEFAPDPAARVAEAQRVLRPGGSLAVAILNRTGPWTLWRRLKRRLVRSIWRHAVFLSLEELRGLLEQSGLRELRWRGAVHFLPLPAGRSVRHLERWEAVAARWVPGRATFLVVQGQRA